MKGILLNSLTVFVILLVSMTCTFSQTIEKLDLLPGSELQGGIGNFGDPTTHHGFSLALNGSLGISSKSNTFGYDAFSVNTRWVPGTGKFGKRIVIQFGAANWFTPSLSAVYRDTVLSSTEKIVEGKTVNNVMAGLSFQLAKSRDIREISLYQDSILQDYDFKVALNSGNDIKVAELRKRQAEYKWTQITRPALRELSVLFGGMFRLGNLGTETDITAADIFATVARGKGIFDFVGSVHYLKPLDKELIAKSAQSLNIGAFFDLDDAPPINTMGLSLGLGRYNYYEKTRSIQIDEQNLMLSNKPHTYRFDVTVSFSGLFKDIGLFGSSVAFRYSNLNHSSTKRETQFNVLLTSKFINSRSE